MLPSGGSQPSAVFAALGDPTRLALLGRLSDGAPRSIASLAQPLTLSRQAVTKHLTVLEGAGLVTRATRGRETQYAGRVEAIDDARAYLEGLSAQWRSALSRLKQFVEDDEDAATSRR